MGSGRANNKKRSKSRTSTSTSDVQDQEGWPTAPSPKRWEELVTYKSFLVRDSVGKDVKFEKGQVVLVLPHGFDPHKEHDIVTYWIAKIKDIRADIFVDGSNTVWVKVQWYYSGKDVGDVIKSFNTKAVGKYERIFSDHHDCIQPEAFEAKIPMYKFNEEDHEQRYIPEESFYRRSTLEYRARSLQPKPGSTTCVCQEPYNPDDMDPLKLIHFCPRPSCRRGYHHRCLIAKKSKESSSAGASKVALTTKIPTFDRVAEHETIRVQRSARKHAVPPKSRLGLRVKKKQQDLEEEAQVVRVVFPTSPGRETVEDSLSPPNTPTQSISLTERCLRLLACSPDTDETLVLEVLIPEVPEDDMDASEESDTDSSRPRKKHRGRSQRKVTQFKTNKSIPEKATLATIFSTIPPDLLRVAIQPLVRGGAFRGGGVAGNIGMVTHARRLIYAALQMGGGPGSVPDEWKDIVFGDDRTLVGCGLENAIVRIEDRNGKEVKTLPPFVCLNCKSAI